MRSRPDAVDRKAARRPSDDDAVAVREPGGSGAYLLDCDAALEIVDDGPRRGFGLHHKGRMRMLGATDDQTAAAVFWRMLAGSGDTPFSCGA